MGTEKSSAFCDNCGKQVSIERQTPNHILHLLLSVITCGLWLLVWMSQSAEKQAWRCAACGKELGGGSDGWGAIGSMLATPPITADDALRACPSCREQIRRDATKCKHCGTNVDPIVLDITKNHEEFHSDKRIGYIATAVFIFLIYAMVRGCGK